jgi:hypothetical protein
MGVARRNAPEMAEYEVVDEAQYSKFECNAYRLLSLGLGLSIRMHQACQISGCFEQFSCQ